MSFSNGVRIVIMPGLQDSGPTHWQSRWQALYPEFERVRQDDWETADLDRWAESLDAVVRASNKPVIIAAHSFGCLASVQCASSGIPNLAGALLVAPADPAKFGLEERLEHLSLPIPSILIGSQNDPWMDCERAARWAGRWGSDFLNAGNLGHINADSDIGDWLFGLAQLQRLAFRFSRSSTQNFQFMNRLAQIS
jgi:uncharacterized protein